MATLSLHETCQSFWKDCDSKVMWMRFDHDGFGAKHGNVLQQAYVRIQMGDLAVQAAVKKTLLWEQCLSLRPQCDFQLSLRTPTV